MKLVRVGHYKCDSVDYYTYLLAPEDKTQEQIEEDVATATSNHLNALKTFETASKPKYLQGLLREFSEDITIQEANRLLEENHLADNEYNKLRNQAGQSFMYWMRQIGYKDLSEAEDTIEVEAYWGHNHGLSIDVSKTDTDYKPVKRLK